MPNEIENGERQIHDTSLDSRLLEHHVIWLYGTITTASASAFCKKLQLLDLTWLRSGRPDTLPVTCYINSVGGNKNDALGIVDTVRLLSMPCVAIGVGQVASAAVWVLASFPKRYAFENTRFLLHEGWSAAEGKPSDVKAFQREDQRVLKIMTELLAEFTKKDVERIKLLLQRETFFGAKEAKRLGLIDDVIYSAQQHD